MTYAKPWTSYAEQVDQLINRGMLVEDRARALDCLERIGYYRLSGYWFAFRERSGKLILLDEHGRKPKKPKVETIPLENFKPGATFRKQSISTCSTKSFDCWQWMRWSASRLPCERISRTC